MSDFFDPQKFIDRTLKATKGMRDAANGDRHEPINEAIEVLEGVLFLGASIADSLQRIAKAQETVAELARVDIEATIAQEVDARLAPAVNKEMEERSKRSYIGKKDA